MKLRAAGWSVVAGAMWQMHAPEAQAAAELSGQFRNLLYVAQRGDVAGPGSWNGLRLDIQSASSDERVRFRGSIDLSYGFGDAQMLQLAQDLTLPEGLAGSRLNLDLFRAYLQVRGLESRAELTLGRQRLAWGTGLVLRPTDAFEPTDLFDPYRELHGVNALRFTMPISGSLYLDGVARLDDASSLFQLGMQAGVQVPSLEVQASVVHDGIHGREQIGLALRKNRGLNLWFDGVVRVQNDSFSSPYDDADLSTLLEMGSGYTFAVGRGLTVELEYLYLSNGDSFGGGNDLQEAVRDYRVLQGQHYGYLSTLLEVKERLSVQLGVLINALDGSLVVQPRIIGRPLDTLELSLGAQLFVGSNGDEFARGDLEQEGDGAALYYAQTTWYF